MGKVLKSNALRNVRRASENVRRDGLKKKSKSAPRRGDRRLDTKQHVEQPIKLSNKKKAAAAAAAAEPANYGSQEYWESRHANSADFDSKFEWFLSYQDLKPILQASGISYENRKGMFIDLGCGTSRFLMELKQDGYRGSCLGLDYSAEAIQRMKAVTTHQVDYSVADATKFASNPDNVNAKVILDKSLMDTMLHQMGESGEEAVEAMLQQVSLALANESTFIVVTQMDPTTEKDAQFLTEVVVKQLTLNEDKKFLSEVVAHITSTGEDDDEEEGDDGALPVPTVFVFQFKPISKKPANFVLEMEIVEYEANARADGEEDSEEEDEDSEEEE